MKCSASRSAALAATMAFLLFADHARAADVWLYKATKGIHFSQVPGGAPSVLTNNGYVFQANVFLIAPGTVSAATVASQEGTVRALAFDNVDELEFRNRVNTRNTLETRYPDGNFRFTINATRDGTRTPTLPLLGNSYPNAPSLHNLGQLQVQNANGYIALTWTPLAGGTANDYIQLRIEDSAGDLVWETPDLGEVGAMDGTSGVAIIKAGNLRPSTRYAATLVFEKSCGRDTTSYPGALGWSTYHTRTEFTVATTSAAEPNVKRYEVRKGRSFEQTNSAPPFPESGNEYIFSADIWAAGPNLVNSATIRTPTGSTFALQPNSDRDELDFSESMTTQAALDAKYPSGVYTFTIQTANQGTRAPNLHLSAAAYPPAPRVQFDPTRLVPAQGELRITWDPWPDGNANDYIQLRIEDNDETIFETPDFDDKDRLDGRATGAVVPAGTLTPGKSYNARLAFHRCVAIDSSSYAGALGQAIYFSRTKFDFETVPPDVKNYQVRKSRITVQSSSGAPVVTGFVFTAILEAEHASSLVGAAIVTPLGQTATLYQQSDGRTFRFRDARASQAVFDADYPDGHYSLVVNGVNDGERNIAIALAGAAYPNTPRINNYDAAGRIDHSAPFALHWHPFAGGTRDDYVEVEIEQTDGDEVFDTPGFGKDDALDGLDTHVDLPAFLLESARIYHGKLYFENVLRADDAGYPGVDGRVGYAAETHVTLATSGAGNPPALSSYRRLADGRFQFNVSTLDGGTYEIQGSTNLLHWTTLGTIAADDGRAAFTAPAIPSRRYFYRARWMR